MATLSYDPLWPRSGNWPGIPAGNVDAVVVGVPTHTTSLSPTQAHLTPDAIRQALPRYGTVATGRDGQLIDVAQLSVADAGNVPVPDSRESDAIALMNSLCAQARLLIALGGDNACTVPTALGAWGRQVDTAGLITIDAHHDLRDGVSNGSPVRRLIESGLDPRRVVQIGISDFANSPQYTRRAQDLGITVFRRDAVTSGNLADIAAQALALAGAAGGPVHVDVDVDVCDRSVAPGCPASTPGGISAFELRVLVRHLVQDPQVTSLDIAEIDAGADVSDGRTVRLGALVILEALAGLASRNG